MIHQSDVKNVGLGFSHRKLDIVSKFHVIDLRIIDHLIPATRTIIFKIDNATVPVGHLYILLRSKRLRASDSLSHMTENIT